MIFNSNLSVTLLLLILSAFSHQQQSTNLNNIIFDLADLTIDFETDTGHISLEAFKSSLNDLIIEKKDVEKYGQLTWLSIGYPKLVLLPNAANQNKPELISFRPDSIDFSVEMLTSSYRNLFINVVKRKYNIDIKPEQIVSLIPSKFDCQIAFYTEGSKVIINGRVKQLNKFPLRLSFLAPLKSSERTLFEERLKSSDNNLDLDIVCEINSQGKAYRQNTLVITGEQMSKLALVEKIFGNGDENVEKYVTRDQVAKISSEFYQKLNVIEEYQMPETQFKENFIEDFIKQTAVSLFEYVSIDRALSHISQYDFSQDIRPNVVKEELSRLFYINKTDSKEFLLVNQSQLEKLDQQSSSTRGGQGGASFLGIKLSASGKYVDNQNSEWKKSSASLSNQINELNKYNQNEVEWQRKGDIIEAKSIKVCKLARGSFTKSLVFSRVKREFYDAPYKRIFTLNTLANLFTPELIIEHSQRLASLEEYRLNVQKILTDLNITINTSLDDQNKSLNTNIVNISGSFESKLANLSQIIDNFKNTLTNNQNSINHLSNLNSQLSSKVNTKLSSCRICFRENEGSSQCQGTRNSCSPYASVNANSPGWTAEFRDDTDKRAGGCIYQWMIECV